MKTSTVAVNSLSQEKQDFYNRLDSWDFAQGVQLMDVGQVADFQQSGSLDFNIPGFETDTFTAIATRINYRDEDNYLWSGRISGMPGGYFIFASNSGARGGLIQLEENSYSLLPLGDTLCVLVQNDVEKYNDLECASTSAAEEELPDYCEEDDNDCIAVIDAVLLWTPGALAWLDNNLENDFIQAIYVTIGTESVNWAFENSGIPNKSLRTRSYSEVFNFTFSNNPQNIAVDVNNLAANQDAQDIRDEYRADLVIMLTDEGYDSGFTFGRVAAIGPDEDSSFAIVEVPFFILPRWTFAHEVGHLLGARHRRGTNQGDDNTDVCAHGLRFLDSGSTERNTLLAPTAALNPGDAGGRILHYSNPDVDFNGAATGTVDDDNARYIRNTGCPIRSFQPNPEIIVRITGNPIFCHPDGEFESKTFEAYVEPAAPGMPVGLTEPYSYEWSWNESGIFPGTVIGTGSDITINTIYNCPEYFLHLKVTGDNEAFRITTQLIITEECDHCEPQSPPLVSHIGEQFLTEKSVEVFPNPTTDIVNLHFTANPENVEIQLYDAIGQNIPVTTTETLNKGNLEVAINIKNVPAGIYFLSIKGEGNIITKKLVIAR